VHDLGRIRRDDAGARVLLRPVVEVEPDARLACEIEAEVLERLEAHRHGLVLREHVRERRHAPDVGDVSARRLVLPLLTEQPVDPALAEPRPRIRLALGGVRERRGERAQVYPLHVLAPLHRIGFARQIGLELVAAPHEVEPAVVERRRGVGRERPELVARGVLVEERELGLRHAERHGLAAEVDALGEHGVLELVVGLGQLERDEPALARVAQAHEPLALVTVRPFRRLAERGVLVAREEVGVARHDRGVLAHLLLAHAHLARLLGALSDIRAKPFLELSRCERRHASPL
jgi:hypothetical protein